MEQKIENSNFSLNIAENVADRHFMFVVTDERNAYMGYFAETEYSNAILLQYGFHIVVTEDCKQYGVAPVAELPIFATREDHNGIPCFISANVPTEKFLNFVAKHCPDVLEDILRIMDFEVIKSIISMN